jgi:pimeloyl-ACP methyl ester carboxylesterase
MTPSWVAHLGVRLARTMPMVSQAEIDGLAEAFGSFADHGARSAFTHTVRGALNLSGQRLDGTERLYLLADTPLLLVTGNRDSVIPCAHTLAAHDALPDSRLEVFDDAGHFPHAEQPHPSPRRRDIDAPSTVGSPAPRATYCSRSPRVAGY